MTIITKKITTINAIGTHTRPNCKQVYCITEPTIYASVLDAAEALGTHPGNISNVFNGKSKTCKGMRFCRVSDMADYVEEIAEVNQNLYAKAKIYDEELAKREAVRKANEEYEKRKVTCEKLRKKLAKEEKLMAEAENRLKEVN